MKRKFALFFMVLFILLTVGCKQNEDDEQGITKIIFTKDYKTQKIVSEDSLEFSKEYYALVYSGTELSKITVSQKNTTTNEDLGSSEIDVSGYSVSQFYKLNGFYAASFTPDASKGIWEITVSGEDIDGKSVGSKKVSIEVVASYNTVSFESNGGSTVASQQVELDYCATEPDSPTKEGFKFSGWYTSDKLTTKFDFSNKITKNTTLYAKWLLASTDVSCSVSELSDLLKCMESDKKYTIKITDKNITWSSIPSIGSQGIILDLSNCTETETIGAAAFQSCSGLYEIKLPSSIKTIEKNAFYCCTNLSEIEIPEGVTTIGEYAFSHTGLKAVSIPNTVTSLGNHAFSVCSSLESVQLSNSLKIITEGTFADDSAITTISIPYGIETLEKTSFYGLSKVTSLVIPDTVTSIGYETFMYWRALKTVVIPTSLESIASLGFGYCTGLTDVYYKGTEEQWKNIKITNDYSSNKEFLNATRHYNYSE